jgi:hypothetical protein
MNQSQANAPARKQPKFQSITLKWDMYSDISAEAARLGMTRAQVVALAWQAYMATQQPATGTTLEVRA